MTNADSEGDPEEFSEPPELFCDDCQDACSIEELEECPSSGDEVKHGVIAYESYCTGCCDEHFKSGGCRIEVGNCDRATELMAKHIKEFAGANGYSIFRENPRVFVDKNKVFCIGDNDISAETVFEDKLTLISEGKFDLFEGKESVLVKADGKKYNFSKETLKEIFDVFKELGCDEDCYGFLHAKGFLVVLSDGMFGVFTPQVDEIEFFDEKSGFMQEMKHGYSFFDLSKKDGLVLVDAEMMDFNWPKLGEFDFVKLCRGIFALLPNIEEAKITEGSGDLRQDISAVEILNSLTGTEKKKWTIQCKHYPSRKIAPSDIPEILNSYAQLKFDVFCLMTSNYLLPSCDRLLKTLNNSQEFKFKVMVWDKDKLESFIRDKPELFARYFVK